MTTAPLTPVCDIYRKMIKRHAQRLQLAFLTGNQSLNDTLQQMDNESEVDNMVQHSVFEFVIPLIASIGILGNLLNLVILTRRRMLSSMHQLEKSATFGFVALALSDMLFCLSGKWTFINIWANSSSLRKINRINDRYALAVKGHKDQDSQGYYSMQGQCGHK